MNDELDAKRYRWLKANCVKEVCASIDHPSYNHLEFHGAIYPDWKFAVDHIGLDNAIDEAMETNDER